MKHFIFFLFYCSVVNFVTAQKLESSKIPEAVKTSFAKHYPAVKNIDWEMENGEYEASFKDKSVSHAVMFKKDGTFTESEIDIATNELPSPILGYMKEHYKNSPVKEASKITKADGTVNFEAGIKGKDIIFDEQGKFIKEAMD
jgi:hypothetical protein